MIWKGSSGQSNIRKDCVEEVGVKKINPDIRSKTPFDMRSENVDEQALLTLLNVLLSAGKFSVEDLEHAWALVYYYR
jgi:hypothetical protein